MRSSRLRTGLRTLLAAALLALAPPAHADSPELQAFVREVLAKNPSLSAQELRRRELATQAPAEGAWPDPKATVMVDRLPSHGPDWNMPMIRYQLEQMVPWPGKLRMMRGAVEAQADNAAAMREVRRLDLVAETRRSWAMLALNARRRELNEASVSLLGTIVAAARTRYATGLGTHHDFVRAEVERNSLEVERVSLDGERRSMIAMLNALRDAAPDAPIPEATLAESARPTGPMAALLDEATRVRPELSGMEAMRREAAVMRDLALRERYPDLMVGAWANQMMDMPLSAGAMVGATVPVFGLSRQSQRADALALRSQATAADAEAMRAMIRFEVADALRKLDAAEATLQFVRSVGLPKARESFASALAGYTTGGADLTAALEARRAVQTSELALAEALAMREIAIADLDRALGRPRAEERR